jgi:hypothetical protein
MQRSISCRPKVTYALSSPPLASDFTSNDYLGLAWSDRLGLRSAPRSSAVDQWAPAGRGCSWATHRNMRNLRRLPRRFSAARGCSSLAAATSQTMQCDRAIDSAAEGGSHYSRRPRSCQRERRGARGTSGSQARASIVRASRGICFSLIRVFNHHGAPN